MLNVRASDGVSIAYRKMGNGPLAVALIHGWMVDGRVWEPVMRQLAEDAGLTIIAPDLRGAGASDHPDTGYTIERYAKDIEELLASENLSEYWLVGHSMGGTIAQRVAADRPHAVRGLMLVAPVPASGLPIPDEAHAAFRGVAESSEGAHALLQGLVAGHHAHPIIAQLAEMSQGVSPTAILESFDAWRTAHFENDLARYQGVVHVWPGELDGYLTADFLSETIGSFLPQSHIEPIAGSSHYVPLEEPTALATRILSVVKE